MRTAKLQNFANRTQTSWLDLLKCRQFYLKVFRFSLLEDRIWQDFATYRYLCNIMLKFVAIILSGMAVGFLLRKRRLKVVPHMVTVLIWLLLFFLGVEVGENPQVINGITTLGMEALWLSIIGLAGTIAFSWALWHWVSRKKGGDRHS